MTLKLILYDLDGTLMDSFADIGAAVNHAMRALGRPERTHAEIMAMVGDGVHKLIERALGPDFESSTAEALALAIDYYADHPADQSRLYPGALDTLEAISGRGIAQAVLSNKPHEIAVKSCAATGITSRVDRILGGGAGYALKPDPAGARALMKELGASPGETVMVGDGQADMAVARAAGIRALGCAWGTNGADRLREWGARLVFEKIDELPAWIDSAARQAGLTPRPGGAADRSRG